MAFFQEWGDSKEFDNLFLIIALFMFLIIVMIYTTVSSETQRAGIYAFLLLGAIGIYGLYLKSNPVTFGKSWMALALGAGVGVVAFFFLLSSKFSIAAPFSPVIGVGTLPFFYVVIASPIIEEIFFRSAVFFALADKLKGIGVRLIEQYSFEFSSIVTSLFFALYHLAVYSGSGANLWAAFVFSIVCIVGNQVFKSLGFSIAAHAINNFMVFTRH